MDTRRWGIVLLLVASLGLLCWNLKASSPSNDARQPSQDLIAIAASGIEETPSDVSAVSASSATKGLPSKLGLGVGQALTYQSFSPEVKQAMQELQDVTIVRPWPEPSWYHVLSSSARDRPTKELRSNKMRECPLTILMQWAFKEGCSEDYSLFVDIGMNIGWFTALAAASGLHVVAIEPSPAKVKYMTKTVDINDWGKRVRLLQGGISDHGQQLYVDDSKLWGQKAASKEGGSGKVAVKSFRLDDVVNSDAKVCVLKVDCRGCETEAFLSGSKLIAAGLLQAVQLEYDHSVDAQQALEKLRELSPRPWQCIILPAGLSCTGSDLVDVESESQRDIWDFIVNGVSSDCRASKLEQLAPKKVRSNYHTDLWLVHDDTIDRLRAQPGFVAAAQRLADAEGQSCKYSDEQASDIGVCDLLCHQFSTLEEAQKTCDGRPTCTKVLRWKDPSSAESAAFFELRGAAGGAAQAASGGFEDARAYLKLSCTSA